MNAIENLMLSHKSVRRFTDQPVSDELLERVVRCGQHAATSEFIQAYTIIKVTDPKVKEAIYNEVTSQKPILSAPVFLVFCADVSRLLRASEMNQRKAPESYLEYTETFLMASVDTAIAAQNTVIAAESEGVGCTYIGGIRNNLPKVMELLSIPNGVYPLFGLVMGYPLENSDEAAKPRLPLDVVLKEEKYHTDGEEEQIRAYDEVIRQYYIDRTDGKRDETWSMQMADFVEKPQRPFLKEVLGKQGFLLK
ncbi:oxygen-insensitive NADPH nitroreductase [Emergencia timonensis]|uniref:oxygen-insensitive NADPH nitroreductase n=1 Tax=Emergencia timonensis TaxID=1776384 RepID=UPI0039935DDD